MRYQVPLVVVANPDLLGNHQAETARHVAAAGYGVVGRLGALAEALREAREQTVKRNLDSLPPYREPEFPPPERCRRTLLDWTVLTCYPDELTRKLLSDNDKNNNNNNNNNQEEVEEGGGGGGGGRVRVSNASMDVAMDSLDAYDRKLALECLNSG